MSPCEIAARDIFLHALSACSIERAIAERLSASGASGLDLNRVPRLLVIAMGKAAASMLAALLKRDDVSGRDVYGLLVAPAALDPMPSGFAFFHGAHPLPDEQSFAAAREILRLLDEATADTFCLFLISGGASAMVELPLDTGISLQDTIAFHRALVHSGASIVEMNCVRKHFSAVKGGRLAQRASHLRQLTVLISDVAPARLDALASGPTLPDRSTVADCREVLAKYDLLRDFPESVARFFLSKDLVETPKANELRSRNIVLLSSDDLAEQARLRADSLGYCALVDNACDDWGYREAAEYLLERVRRVRREHGRVCLISVGEILVRVPARSDGAAAAPPAGGRNQHFVLYAGTQMQDTDGGLTVLSCGSDGIDGNSPAAGAVLSFESAQQPSREQWMRSAGHALESFSSFNFLRSQGCTIETGPTGNNLRDLRLLLFE